MEGVLSLGSGGKRGYAVVLGGEGHRYSQSIKGDLFCYFIVTFSNY